MTPVLESVLSKVTDAGGEAASGPFDVLGREKASIERGMLGRGTRAVCYIVRMKRLMTLVLAVGALCSLRRTNSRGAQGGRLEDALAWKFWSATAPSYSSTRRPATRRAPWTT